VAITPRAGDGRISRAQAAELAGVEPDTITAWIAREHLTDIRREGRRVWLNPAEVIEAEHKLAERARRDRWDRRLIAAGSDAHEAA
jgi:hypothetical protein